MSDSKIIETLKMHPRLDVSAVARLLDIPSVEVSQAQHQYLRTFMRAYRVSDYWNVKQYFSHAVKQKPK